MDTTASSNRIINPNGFAGPEPVCIYDGDRLLFDYDDGDPDSYTGTYVITDRNGAERGRGRFSWNNGTRFDTWAPADT